jgi:hypothetical protein
MFFTKGYNLNRKGKPVPVPVPVPVVPVKVNCYRVSTVDKALQRTFQSNTASRLLYSTPLPLGPENTWNTFTVPYYSCANRI